MVTLTIEVDEATDRVLRELAKEHGGDIGRALGELLGQTDDHDVLADELEAGQEQYLKAHLERSLKDYAEGRVHDWEAVKSRFKL